jgi:hypothetical protein
MSRFAATVLCGALTLTSPTLVAAPIDDKGMGEEPALALMNDADLRSRLMALGIAGAEVDQRLANLTTDERTQLTQHLSSLPAGGDSTVTISVGAAIIIVLLLIILL